MAADSPTVEDWNAGTAAEARTSPAPGRTRGPSANSARLAARLAGRPAPGPDASGGRAPGADSPYLWRAGACGLRAWRSRARKVPRAGWIIGTARIRRGQLGRAVPRPRRPLDADGVGRPVSVGHFAVRKRPSAFQSPAGPAGSGRRWNMIDWRSPPAPGARRRPHVRSQHYRGREQHRRRMPPRARRGCTRPRNRESPAGRCGAFRVCRCADACVRSRKATFRFRFSSWEPRKRPAAGNAGAGVGG